MSSINKNLPPEASSNSIFNDPKLNEKFKADLQFYEKSTRTNDGDKFIGALEDHWLGVRGVWNYVKRGAKTFDGLLESELGIREEDLNWIFHSKLGDELFGDKKFDVLHEAIHNPQAQREMIDKLKGVMSRLDAGSLSSLSGKERIQLWNLTANIYQEENLNAEDIAYKAYDLKSNFFVDLEVDKLQELQDDVKSFIYKVKDIDEKSFDFSTELAAKIASREFKDLDVADYKKALGIYGELILEGYDYDYNPDFFREQASLAIALTKKYADIPTEKVVEKVKEYYGLNDTKVFHTNAPELIKDSGIILSSTGARGTLYNQSKAKTENLQMPELSFKDENFQISGHHIIRTKEPSYLVYVAHNKSNSGAEIKIATAGISTTSESGFDDHSHKGSNRVSSSRRTVGPGDAAALEVLEGKIDHRVDKSINLKAGETKLITAVETDGYETVTANINGHIDGAVQMTGAIVTQSELSKYGSIEAAVNAQLKSGKFTAREEFTDKEGRKEKLGRANGVYTGSEYNQRKNLFLRDSEDLTNPVNILNESVIASIGANYDVDQSGPAVADLGKFSSPGKRNVGNYNVRYRMEYNIENLRTSSEEPKLGFKFKSEAENGREDQAAFRGNVKIYIKDKEGRIIDKINRQLSVGFGDEVNIIEDLKLTTNASSIEIDMINTADSTPPYRITAFSS